MALHWDISKIENYKEVCRLPPEKGEEVGDLTPVTESLIWATMEIEMGQITEANYVEFWMRLSALDALCEGEVGRIYDPEKSRGGKKFRMRPITLEEVRNHIGLGTNVSTKKSSAEFYKKMLKKAQRVERDRLANLERKAKKLKEEEAA